MAKTTTSRLKPASAETDKFEDSEVSAEAESTAGTFSGTTVTTTTKDSSDENESKSGVTFTAKNNDNNKVKLETLIVVTNHNHRCNIGGVWYDFEAGKPAVVPANVKTILKKAGLLAAI